MNTTESVEQNQDNERHREMVFTVYDRLRDTAGKPISKNWEDWAALFQKHDVRGDPSASNDPEALKASKDGPAVVLGKLADGLGRKNAHVTSIEALALDFDGVESDEVVDAISPLCDSNFEFVLYSTHSHGAACKQSACYYRVIVPLKDPIEPDRLREAWDRLNNFTGAISDRGMREPARMVLLPSTFDPSLISADHRVGRFLDPFVDLPPAESFQTSFPEETARDVADGTIVANEDFEKKSIFDDAVDRFNRDHPLDWEDLDGSCPICGHRDCFRSMPDNPQRWCCFSSNHPSVGVKGEGCYHGDSLDIESHLNCRSREGELENSGYLPSLIVHRTGEGHCSVDAILEILARRNDVFFRGGQLVSVAEEGDTDASPVVRVSQQYLWELLSRYARWKKPTSKKGLVAIDPPNDVVRAVFSRGRWPGISELRGVTSLPLVRIDGSVHDIEGLDSVTGLYYRRTSLRVPFTSTPSQGDAKTALIRLLEVVEDFPWATDAARAGWIAALITRLARSVFDGNSPFFHFDAHTPGSGKTLACDVIGTIVDGKPMQRTPFTYKDDEMRKLLTAQLMRDEPFVLIDNIPNGAQFGSASLDNVLTASVWHDRILGASEMASLPVNAVFFGTGNNIGVRGDTARRTLQLRLEVSEENPEERSNFKHHPLLSWVERNRSQLLGYGYEILRAYYHAGLPEQNLKPFGSFEAWSKHVRAAIVWAGGADPVECVAKSSGADPEIEAFLRVSLCLWKMRDEHNDLTSQGLVGLAGEPFAELRSAMAEYCMSDSVPNTRELGRRLSKHKGRVFTIQTEQGLRKVALQQRKTSGSSRWRLVDKGI